MQNQPIEANVYQVVVNVPKGNDVYIVTTDFVSKDNKEWITAHFQRNLNGIDLPSHLGNTKRSNFTENILEAGTSTDTWQGTRDKEWDRVIQRMKEIYGEKALIDIKPWKKSV